MSAVSVKVDVLRKEGYSSLQEWMQCQDNVYVGRRGRVFIHEDGGKRLYHYSASKWHNPYKVSKECDLDTALELYQQHLCNMLQEPAHLQEFLLLKGKTLGCWCKPGKCHADVILSVLEQL